MQSGGRRRQDSYLYTSSPVRRDDTQQAEPAGICLAMGELGKRVGCVSDEGRVAFRRKRVAILQDGRKPPGWRDRLETEIYGDWMWDEGHVVGHLRERSQPVVTSRHGCVLVVEEEWRTVTSTVTSTVTMMSLFTTHCSGGEMTFRKRRWSNMLQVNFTLSSC